MNRKQLCTFTLLNSACVTVLSLLIKDASGMFHSLFCHFFFNFRKFSLGITELQFCMQLTDFSLFLKTCSWGGRLLYLLYLLITSACGLSRLDIRIKSVAGWVPQELDS